MINGELIVDNFAGGGGASTGIELATGYSVDIAINHDPEAIKMHKANHPLRLVRGIQLDLPGFLRTANILVRQKAVSQKTRTFEDLPG